MYFGKKSGAQGVRLGIYAYPYVSMHTMLHVCMHVGMCVWMGKNVYMDVCMVVTCLHLYSPKG